MMTEDTFNRWYDPSYSPAVAADNFEFVGECLRDHGNLLVNAGDKITEGDQHNFLEMLTGTTSLLKATLAWIDCGYIKDKAIIGKVEYLLGQATTPYDLVGGKMSDLGEHKRYLGRYFLAIAKALKDHVLDWDSFNKLLSEVLRDRKGA